MRSSREMLGDLPDVECSCERCVSMCQHLPCWPLPEEAEALIKAGHGDRLMADWWEDENGRRIWILCPAGLGQAGLDAPIRYWWSTPEESCVFLTSDGKCALHVPGLKPIEGRKASCKNESPFAKRKLIAAAWRKKYWQDMVREWRKTRAD